MMTPWLDDIEKIPSGQDTRLHRILQIPQRAGCQPGLTGDVANAGERRRSRSARPPLERVLTGGERGIQHDGPPRAAASAHWSCLESSSRTKTQSWPCPREGGRNSRRPRRVTVSMSSEVPRRGSYQEARSFSPESLSRSTVNGCPDAE